MIEGLTNFADQGVILPVFAGAALLLLLIGWWRAAASWAVVVPLVLGTVLIGKLAALACAPGFARQIDLVSPSGHTASAAVVYGGLVALLVRGRRPELVAILAASLFAALIGASRLALHLHTAADVLVGGPVGILGAWLLVRLAGPRPATLRHLMLARVAVVAGAVLVHGVHLSAEQTIIGAARVMWPFSLCRR